MTDFSGMEQRLGDRLSGHYKGKGRSPHVLSKTQGISQTSPLLILSSTVRASAVTFSWPLPKAPHLYFTQSPCSFHHSTLQTQSTVERQKLCSERGFTVLDTLHVATFLLKCYTLGWLQWRPLGLRTVTATVENIIKDRDSANMQPSLGNNPGNSQGS